MARHAEHGDWREGDYVAGRIDRLDEEGRGVIGGRRSPIRVSGDIEEGNYAYGEITRVGEDVVVAERARRPPDDTTVWAQQSEDAGSTCAWHPEYPLGALPHLNHCNLFSPVSPGAASEVNRHGIEKERAPWLWRTVIAVLDLVVGIAVLGAAIGVIWYVLDGSVISMWGAAIDRSSVMLVVFLLGLALTYAGFAVFEWLIRLSGMLVGLGVGVVVTGALGLTGVPGLLVIGLSASLFGALFLFLHYLAIVLGAFGSVAVPTAYVLSGGAVLTTDIGLTSVWLLVPLAVAVVLGAGAAVLAVVAYKFAIAAVTSFLGASVLVYLPRAARATAAGGDIGFPSVTFLSVFVSGLLIQLLFGAGSE